MMVTLEKYPIAAVSVCRIIMLIVVQGSPASPWVYPPPQALLSQKNFISCLPVLEGKGPCGPAACCLIPHGQDGSGGQK